jgi:hypothetical protein
MISDTYRKMCVEHPEVARVVTGHSEPYTGRGKGPQRLTLRGLLYSETIAVEFGLAMISALCGLLLLIPGQSFSLPFPTLGEYIDENITGTWMICLGLTRIVALCSGHVRFRQAMAFAAWLTWLFLFSWILVTDPMRLSIVFFFSFSIASFWVFMRVPTRLEANPSPPRKG